MRRSTITKAHFKKYSEQYAQHMNNVFQSSTQKEVDYQQISTYENTYKKFIKTLLGVYSFETVLNISSQGGKIYTVKDKDSKDAFGFYENIRNAQQEFGGDFNLSPALCINLYDKLKLENTDCKLVSGYLVSSKPMKHLWIELPDGRVLDIWGRLMAMYGMIGKKCRLTTELTEEEANSVSDTFNIDLALDLYNTGGRVAVSNHYDKKGIKVFTGFL